MRLNYLEKKYLD